MQKQYLMVMIITIFLVIGVAVLVAAMTKFMLAYAVTEPVPKYIAQPPSLTKTKSPVYGFEEERFEAHETSEVLLDEILSTHSAVDTLPTAAQAVVDTPPTAVQAVKRTVSAQAVVESDIELLARLLYAECRGESRAGQLMVAQCVLDRVANGAWGRSIPSVIYSLGQFAKPGKLTDELLLVARSAMAGERFRDECVILYFRRTNNSGDWFAPYLGRIGAHSYYGYLK